eukprot:Gb_35749 [translate_table: standard]
MDGMTRHSFTERMNFTAEMLSADSLARQLGDQMTLAKAYVVIAKENNNLQLAWELSAQIRGCQLLLSKAATRGSPVTMEEAEPTIRELSLLIYQAKELHYDSATMIMKLKAQIQALEDRANAATVQSTTFGQLAAEGVPKGLYCLGVRLTIECAKDSNLQKHMDEQKSSPRLTDINLYHFCVFSDNILATSVVINSTVQNADHPKQLVFHVVTDDVNYGAMQAWFSMNDFKGATIELQSVDDFTWLNASYVPVLKQLQDAETQLYYFTGLQDTRSAVKFRNPKYLSMLNHLRFYIPEVYPALDKVVFLDDDVVVQKDLTPLFSIDLHGNVNGAVETCLETFHRYHKYLNFSHPKIHSHFDPDACGWAFGMNVFDLVAWKKANVTSRYHYWQEQNVDRTLWKLGTLPPGLLTFYGLTEPLDRRWHVLGLGYDPNVDDQLIESGAVVHYNGNMKPWLKLAMNRDGAAEKRKSFRWVELHFSIASITGSPTQFLLSQPEDVLCKVLIILQSLEEELHKTIVCNWTIPASIRMNVRVEDCLPTFPHATVSMCRSTGMMLYLLYLRMLKLKNRKGSDLFVAMRQKFITRKLSSSKTVTSMAMAAQTLVLTLPCRCGVLLRHSYMNRSNKKQELPEASEEQVLQNEFDLTHHGLVLFPCYKFALEFKCAICMDFTKLVGLGY